EPDLTPVEPLGPPSLDTVQLRQDGSVVCQSSATVPAVFEIAILLDEMLPAGSIRVPGGLRYTIARALVEGGAPPFESVVEFSAVLARYERGDRRDILRQLYARAAHAVSRPRRVVDERRRRGPSATVLRHQLREADQTMFRLLKKEEPELEAVPAVVFDTAPLRTDADAGEPLAVLSAAQSRGWVRPFVAIAAILLSAAAGYVAVHEYRQSIASRE